MDWRRSNARPANVHSSPERTYKQDGWQGCGHWLGTGNVGVKHNQFLPFKEALLRRSNARPANVPSSPELTYKHDGWQGCGHWLGTGNM